MNKSKKRKISDGKSQPSKRRRINNVFILPDETVHRNQQQPHENSNSSVIVRSNVFANENEVTSESIIGIRNKIKENTNKYTEFISSNHSKYKSEKPLKIFFFEDQPKSQIHHQCIPCEFTAKSDRAYKSHISTNNTHQLNTLQFHLNNNITFPNHFILKDVQLQKKKEEE
eukprot:8807_1